ncbi:uncharacterized protein LOC123007488 [Tribolium madens]|uniref:uncharacterized protein LOC123007488 n=1 Tax=Tribolium madens TaxID=41895 RepID=UPI001CF76469|nr:uncharacterized protein LOC123007488 [Tribolium madens]
MKLLVVVIFLIPSLATAFRFHQRPNIYVCRKRGINCINENTFVFCRGFFQHILVDKYSFQCPEGYLCSNNSKFTCIEDPDYKNDSDESGEISTTESDVVVTFVSSKKPIDHSTEENQDSDESGETEPEPVSTTVETTEDDIDSAEKEDITSFIPESTTYSPESSEENETTDQSEENNADEAIDDNDQNINIEPKCTSVDETFPGPSCSKYYKCQSMLIWTFPVLQLCEDGKSFDTATSSCVPSSESDCTD